MAAASLVMRRPMAVPVEAETACLPAQRAASV